MKKAILKRLSLMLLIFLSVTIVTVAQRTITGTVTDDAGESLIGASVLLKGTTSGTVTDIDGAYSIEVPEGEVTIVFSYTGYSTTEIEVVETNIVDAHLEESLDVVLSGGFCCFCYCYISEEEYWQNLIAEKAALKAANIEKRRLRRLKRRAERSDRKAAEKVAKEWEEIQARIAGNVELEKDAVENFTDNDKFANLQFTMVAEVKQEVAITEQLPEVQVYPNPVVDVLQVQLEVPLEKDGLIEVFNANGQVVKTAVLLSQQTIASIDLGAITEGFYTLKIPNKNTFIQKKIIKQ